MGSLQGQRIQMPPRKDVPLLILHRITNAAPKPPHCRSSVAVSDAWARLPVWLPAQRSACHRSPPPPRPQAPQPSSCTPCWTRTRHPRMQCAPGASVRLSLQPGWCCTGLDRLRGGERSEGGVRDRKHRQTISMRSASRSSNLMVKTLPCIATLLKPPSLHCDHPGNLRAAHVTDGDRALNQFPLLRQQRVNEASLHH